MIKEVYYSYLNPENLINLALQSVKIIKTNHPEERLFTRVLAKLEETIKQAEQAVGKITKEALTQKVFDADVNRDTTFIGFKMHIEAGLKRHRNPVYFEACERLDLIINKHDRNVYKLPYAEQTTVFHSLLEELRTPVVQEDLVIVNGIELVTELDQDQQDFEAIFTKRNIDKAADTGITDKESVQILRPELKKLYILIDAFYINEQVVGLASTIDEINISIDRIINSAKR